MNPWIAGWAARAARAITHTPVGISSTLFGAPPQNDRGVRLDPQLHMLIQTSERMSPPEFDVLGPVRGRVSFAEQILLADAPFEPLHRVEEHWFETAAGEIRARAYHPTAASSAPALVFFHGGGFVVGDVDAYDRICRRLANLAGVAVVSIDYRLAPEHPFPAATEDTYEAFLWVHREAGRLGLDPNRLAVGGDSAGGNLSAVVCQTLRDRGGPAPIAQFLIYPATDMSRSATSHRTFHEGFVLTETKMDWFMAHYLTDLAQQDDPRASPLAQTDLRGLPPAHVFVAGFDPLRDEGEQYARALRDAGVTVHLRGYDSLVHGFLNMSGLIDAAEHAVQDIAGTIRGALAP